MKLDFDNQLFLTRVALRLKVGQDHMIDLCNTATKFLLGADNDARQSIQKFQRGEISKAQLDGDRNAVDDLIVVQSVCDKQSATFMEAFGAVSSHHMSHLEDDLDFAVY